LNILFPLIFLVCYTTEGFCKVTQTLTITIAVSELGIVVMRFISLGFLIDAMRRIKRVVETDLTQMPNIRIMIAFIGAFALFAASSLTVAWNIVS
jgi:hypothetical protein